MGNTFSDYYAQIGEVFKYEKQRDVQKNTLDGFKELLKQTGFSDEVLNQDELLKKYEETKLQLTKAELFKEELKSREYTIHNAKNQLETLKKELFSTEITIAELEAKRGSLLREIKGISQLKEEIILEVVQLKKIILAHDELNLFSPDTCPYCLRHVEREENHCICGATINESEYERFFYTSEEYLDILHSKQKSLDTVEIALQSCNEELEQIIQRITNINIRQEKVKSFVFGLDNLAISKNNEFNEVDDKILELRESVRNIEQQFQLQKKYLLIIEKFEEAKRDFEKSNKSLFYLEEKVKKLMIDKIKTFNEIYNKLMVESSNEVKNAKLDESYMPVINDGEYKEASNAVPTRFIYFLTLLNMSLKDPDMQYPKFLLIDTPENLGIDHEQLEGLIAKIKEGKTEEELSEFQIILTTGISKYPPELKEDVLQTLTKKQRLLQEKQKL
jgi:chromosome segregation ATPase